MKKILLFLSFFAFALSATSQSLTYEQMYRASLKKDANGNFVQQVVTPTGALISVDLSRYTMQQLQQMQYKKQVDGTYAIVSQSGGGGSGTFVTLSGDATSTATGGATTINSGVVTNTKLATMPTLTMKGNSTGATAAPQDLTATQIKTLLALTSGDVVTTTPLTIDGVVYATGTSTQTILNALNNSIIKTFNVNPPAAYADLPTQISATVNGQVTKDNNTGNVVMRDLNGDFVTILGNSVQLKQSGTNVGGVGTFTKYNFVGATVAQNGTDATQADVTITSGATTNTLVNNATGGLISTVNGTAALFSPNTGAILENIGINASGAWVRQVPTPSSSIQQYSAGNNVNVTADGLGVTATKSSGAWTVTVPVGVKLINASVNILTTDIQTSADGSGATNWVTVNFTGVQGSGIFGGYRLPTIETQVIPAGTVSVTNTVPINTTGQSFIALSAGSLTARKINMANSNDHVLSFSNF